MKVLLMVERDGRVVCAGRVALLSASNDGPRSLKSGNGEYRMTWNQGDAYDRADRWWLVEAPDARQARKVIEMSGGTVGATVCALTGPEVAGRILASGGRS